MVLHRSKALASRVAHAIVILASAVALGSAPAWAGAPTGGGCKGGDVRPDTSLTIAGGQAVSFSLRTLGSGTDVTRAVTVRGRFVWVISPKARGTATLWATTDTVAVYSRRLLSTRVLW